MSANRQSPGLRFNIWLLKFTRNWLRVVLFLLGLYIALPFAAPTLMKLGVTGPARAIYFLYSPFCHQFAFRSFFLFGEQPVYPRANTGSDWQSFESYALESPEFLGHYRYWYTSVTGQPIQAITYDELAEFTPWLQFAAREFRGNEQMGYKVTLCERDIFIYTAMFVGGLGYARVRRRLRPIPFWLYLLLGIVPIGLDGFSQLLGYPPFAFWPPRETLPVFRVVTGALFGFMNVWLGFPYMEQSMAETRQQITDKLTRAGIHI